MERPKFQKAGAYLESFNNMNANKLWGGNVLGNAYAIIDCLHKNHSTPTEFGALFLGYHNFGPTDLCLGDLDLSEAGVVGWLVIFTGQIYASNVTNRGQFVTNIVINRGQFVSIVLKISGDQGIGVI